MFQYAVRIHVLSPAEEIAYFTHAAKQPNLHDIAKLILLQGMRPEDVDLERGTVRIERGKTKAARRALRLRAETRDILARRGAGGKKWLFPGKNPDHPISKLNCPHNRTRGGSSPRNPRRHPGPQQPSLRRQVRPPFPS